MISGIRGAKAKGKSLGRPRRVFRRDEVLRLRAEGISRRKIAQMLDVPMSTVIDSFQQSADSCDALDRCK